MKYRVKVPDGKQLSLIIGKVATVRNGHLLLVDLKFTGHVETNYKAFIDKIGECEVGSLRFVNFDILDQYGSFVANELSDFVDISTNGSMNGKPKMHKG